MDEPEVGAELIGEDEHRRLLLWEAAEGGIGVWERLVNDPGAFAEVARRALDLCHFDPDTGGRRADFDPETCAVACYECLLTYANQPEHRHIDRRLLPEFLLRLASSTTVREEDLDRDGRYRRLRGLLDPASSLESAVLRFLYDNGLRLPSQAQHRPASDVPAQPDFYYARDGVPGICVFVDGPHHDAAARRDADARGRAQLRDRGFRVVTITHRRPIDEQIREHPDVFGPMG